MPLTSFFFDRAPPPGGRTGPNTTTWVRPLTPLIDTMITHSVFVTRVDRRAEGLNAAASGHLTVSTEDLREVGRRIAGAWTT